jgi:hypothetical protein
MSLVGSMLKVPKPEASPAAHWTSAGRIAAATTLVLGAAFPLAAHLMVPVTVRSTYDWLHWTADHPDLANLSKVFELLQMPFLFGTVLVYVLLSRQRSPRLAYAGGILFGCGMVGMSAVHGYETLAYARHRDAAHLPPVCLLRAAYVGGCPVALRCCPARRRPSDRCFPRRGRLPRSRGVRYHP